MNTPPLAKFRLTARLHIELGWVDHVRWAATRNPKVIGYLLQNPEILPRCEDPHTLLESWWPLGNLCVYFIRYPKESSVAEWVITDGVFNQILPAQRMIKCAGRCDEPLFGGMLGDVFAIARNAWSAAQPGQPFPLLPGPSGLPDAVILHRYEVNEAIIAPYNATMDVLASKELL